MKSRKKLLMFLSLVILASILISVLTLTISSIYEESPFITKLDNDLNTDYSKFFGSAVTRLPDGIDDDEEISLIIQTKEKTLLDAYDASGSKLSFADYRLTE
jgi:hypothetical protein